MPNSLWVLLGMMVFFSVLLTIVHRLEKRMVWPYGDLEAAPFFGDPNGYGGQWVDAAGCSGFRMLGWARDRKGPLYRASYAMLAAPGGDVFAVIGVGTIMNINVQATSLFTRSADGRAFYTTDNQTAVQLDVSRNWTSQLCFESSFDSLLAKHREWIQSLGILVHRFTSEREYSEFRAMREAHFRSMERAGLINFLDTAQTSFQFTFSGAAKTAIPGYFLGMARKLSHGRVPRAI